MKKLELSLLPDIFILKITVQYHSRIALNIDSPGSKHQSSKCIEAPLLQNAVPIPAWGANHIRNRLSAHRISRVVTHLNKPWNLLAHVGLGDGFENGVYLRRDPLRSRSSPCLHIHTLVHWTR